MGKKNFSFILAASMLFGGISSCLAEQQSYFLTIDYDKNSYSVQGVELVNTGASDFKLQADGRYRFEVVSFSDESLFASQLYLEKKICGDAFDPVTQKISGGCRILEKGSLSLSIPYYQNGKSINFYDPAGNLILAVDVSDFAKLCGDGVCQGNENFSSCAQDCRSGMRDNYCDKQSDRVCDPDCAKESDSDCREGGAASGAKISVTGLAVAAAIILTLLAMAFLAIKIIRSRAGGRET